MALSSPTSAHHLAPAWPCARPMARALLLLAQACRAEARARLLQWPCARWAACLLLAAPLCPPPSLSRAQPCLLALLAHRTQARHSLSTRLALPRPLRVTACLHSCQAWARALACLLAWPCLTSRARPACSRQSPTSRLSSAALPALPALAAWPHAPTARLRPLRRTASTTTACTPDSARLGDRQRGRGARQAGRQYGW